MRLANSVDIDEEIVLLRQVRNEYARLIRLKFIESLLNLFAFLKINRNKSGPHNSSRRRPTRARKVLYAALGFGIGYVLFKKGTRLVRR